jgi:hypothetical protein
VTDIKENILRLIGGEYVAAYAIAQNPSDFVIKMKWPELVPPIVF